MTGEGRIADWMHPVPTGSSSEGIERKSYLWSSTNGI